MTTRETWLALAERCEKATGPDREIDESILLGLGYTRGSLLSYDFWGRSKGALLPSIVLLTGSIDAITALIVKETNGGGWRMHRVGKTNPTRAVAEVMPPGLRQFDGEARTPALALCAAFCRAMAEKEKA